MKRFTHFTSYTCPWLPPQLLNWQELSDVANVLLALRPFRLVHHVPELTLLVKSLLHSVKSLSTLFGVLIFCAITFASMGVQLFMVSIRESL